MHLIRRTLLAIATVSGIALVALLLYAHLLQERAESLIRITRLVRSSFETRANERGSVPVLEGHLLQVGPTLAVYLS